MKVLVIGAGGIIGQSMMVMVPPGVDATFTRRAEPNHLYQQLDLTSLDALSWLNSHSPDIIVNLAGESRPDVVELDSEKYYEINTAIVGELAEWCDGHGKYLIHVSSQATIDPVNEYGKQKFAADYWLEHNSENWVILRPTFILGIRPFPGIGRENPAERMLGGKETQSVDDRYFAVAFAWDVADYIWRLCQAPIVRRQVHYVGQPDRLSRYDLACLLVGPGLVTPVKHNSLPGLAPRPLDTSSPWAPAHNPWAPAHNPWAPAHNPWAPAHKSGTLADGILRLQMEYQSRVEDDLSYRAKELAAFMKVPYWGVEVKLQAGFGPLHNAVTEDFNRANPQTDEELAEWYRQTDSYIWELTTYHSDSRFNYRGMVCGIAQALKSKGVERVLCLGDGTGDLSLAIADAGMIAIYNDLFCSRTASFAESRFHMRLGNTFSGKIRLRETTSFSPFVTPEEWLRISAPHDPPFEPLDAIVSLDFLEHVPNVEAWVRAIHANLKPGGLFVAQNAFNIGSGPSGSMPMHLAVNDRYEKDWDPLLSSLGFVQLSSNWYQKPV